MTMENDVREFDLRLGDGRTLHVYDRPPAGGAGTESGATPPVVFWQHGTPNLGAPPAPLFAAADRLGLRWLSFDRPGYGASTPAPGRTPATVAADLAEAADSLGIERFAVIGHSGGGTHALAAGAALGDRVLAVVSVAGLAPYGSPDLDWFAGMIPSGQASLRAAERGREARWAHEQSDEVYDPGFTEADNAALGTEWAWLLTVVEPALDAGIDGLIDDDCAYVRPWECDPVRITAPVLLLYGGQDGIVPASHGRWLARHCPTAQLRTYADDGHISILRHGSDAIQWAAGAARAPGTTGA